MITQVEVYFSLGTNLGDRKRNLNEAIELLEDSFGIKAEKVSGFIETEPWGFDSDEKFLNCAVKFLLVRGEESIEEHALNVLEICKDIEGRMGRKGNPEYDRQGNRIYHSRIIDIDILLYGDEKIDLETLKIPHTLMYERDFVMIPLRQIMN